jgi:undecaprenyl diphosphate synthase
MGRGKPRLVDCKPDELSVDALLSSVSKGRLPRHIGIIPDGNGRWAKERGLPRVYGHKEGMKRVREVVECARELGIKALSLYAFSSENWRRPREEIEFLMKLLREFLKSEVSRLVDNDIRFVASGQISGLPTPIQSEIEKVEQETFENKSLILNVCLNYGGRGEIVNAVKEMIKKGLRPEAIDEATFSTFLYTKGMPELDLLIRTSGEFRVSNFFLWQLAYAEVYFTPVLWPDFRKRDFLAAISNFQSRERRFGGL